MAGGAGLGSVYSGWSEGERPVSIPRCKPEAPPGPTQLTRSHLRRLLVLRDTQSGYWLMLATAL